VLGIALAGAAHAAPTADRGSSATIRYTEFGIPHILASDYASLGRGQGYAAARDNQCTIADGMVTTSGERSRYHGPDAPPVGRKPRGSSLSEASTNLASDLYFQGINGSGVVAELAAQPAPLGPRRELRELARGYAGGFNTYLREGHPSECAGAAWLRPMTEQDVYRRLYAVGLYFGQARLADAIVSARPPDPAERPAGARQTAQAVAAAANLLTPSDTSGIGSNAIAVGGAATANGRGLMLANPHLPWHGDLRSWQAHLTIPGRLNVSGAALLGTPLMAFGHTETFAWSGATSTAVPYTLFALRLVPGSPTAYLVDGQPEQMDRRDVTVTVRQADGDLTQVTQPQWWTRYGPVVAPRAGGLELPWTAGTGGEGGIAYALADVNARNLRMGNSLFGINHAGSTEEALTVLRRTQGLSSFNLLGADARGKVFYSGIQVVPNVTDAHATECNTSLGRITFPASGLAVLDGSRSGCGWGNDPGALQPGTFAPGRQPVLQRTDYVANSNESYWLVNPEQKLTGYPRILGEENTERFPRTRSTFTVIAEQLDRGRFTSLDMRNLMLANRNYAGELVVADTVRSCRTRPDGVAPDSHGDPVDVTEACDVLAGWDLRNDIGSRGALLFDRYWRNLTATLRPPQWAELWQVPFDPADPVGTPHTLNPDHPAVPTALADAVVQLRAAQIPLDAPYGDHHYVIRDGETIPMGGAGGPFGTVNIIDAVWDPGAMAYTEVRWGSSYLAVTAFDGSRCPDTHTLLTYSQSSDSTSPHHHDQTELFSQKRWVTERFCERDILTSPVLETVEVR
jgi:acyl-homoserine-lactone acylase